MLSESREFDGTMMRSLGRDLGCSSDKAEEGKVSEERDELES